MAKLDFTGERILPEVGGYFFQEHMSRYKLAKELIKPNYAVLDVGCGAGYGTYFLSEKTKEIVGIDISEDAINLARERYHEDGLTYQKVNPDSWNITPSHFDLAVCFEVFEHIEEPESLLENINKSLNDEGILVISTPNKEVYGDNLPDPYHIREYSLQEFLAIVGKLFEVSSIQGQRNRSQLKKKFNFWLARSAMKHALLMNTFNLMLKLKSTNIGSIQELERIPTGGNYFSDLQPEDADYFILVARKKT